MTDEKILNALIALAEKQTQIMEVLVTKDGDHTKTPATAHTAVRLHGSGGLFSAQGIERDVITAHITPTGLAAKLPLLPNIDENPRYASITGYTAPVGSQPTNVCDDAPTGYMKGCLLTARFGLIRFDTQTIDMDVVMRRLNRGDFTDLMLRGRVLGADNLGPRGLNQEQILNIITMSEMVGVGVQFDREVGTQLWQGTWGVANQFPGLDVQIATGQKDADTGTYCYALDSDVKSYNYRLLDQTIVQYLSQLEWYLHNNAEKMHLLPASWTLAMRPDLWFELSAIWPCAYHTNRCAAQVETGGVVSVDGREMVAIRDAMRTGMYIDINGRRYPVVTDDGIFEHNSTNNANLIPGEFASTIYMVPLTITGNFPVTYREYVDYSKAAPDISLLRGKETFWTDGGEYSWALEQIKWCYKLAAKTEQRVVLRTPQLAGRIDAVKYSPLQHLRDSDPDSPYFMDGGVSVLPGIGTPYGAPWGR